MANLFQTIEDTVRGGVCVALSGVEGLASIGAAIVGGNEEAKFRQAQKIRCLYCGDSDCPDDDIPEPPFTGGQCPGTTYQITATTTVFANGTCAPTTNPFSTTAVGPISGPFTDSVSPPPGGPLCSGTSGTRVYLRVGPSQSILVLAGASFGARVSGLSVTPISGPNNCGDPPTEFPPPPPSTEYNVNITFDDILGVEVTAPITITYNPSTTNFNGDITVPFRVEISPTFDLSGTVNLNTGDVNIRFPTLSNPGETLEEPTVTVPPENAPDPPDPGEEEEGFGIAGVFVYSFRTLTRTAETQIPSNIAPTLLVPRIGSVQFEIQAGDLRGWLPDIDVKSVSTFIPCPVEWGATRVVVRWDEGWGGQFIPLYRDLPVA